MENYLGVMYRIDAGINAYCLAIGDDREWKNDDGEALTFCELVEEAIEERGQELIKKVLSDEYAIRSKAEFNRCFEDYTKLVRYFLNKGRAYYENKILELWLDFLEVQINKQEFKRQEKKRLKFEE